VSPGNLRERAKRLKEHVAALKGIPELRRALDLPGWELFLNGGPVEGVHRAARAEVGRRLEKELAETARTGDLPSRLAVAHLIGVLPKTRALDRYSRKGFASSLAPVLIHLYRDPEPAVRTAAARTLSRINPDPGPAAAALQGLLSKDEVGARRVAAAALDDPNPSVRLAVSEALLSPRPGGK
jgi:HEAT repeat protein